METDIKKICVMGMGYIGLPTSALLANRGFQVHGVDINPKTIEIINQGKIHIVEPELDTFVKAAVESGKLKASLAPAEADVFVLAVPTPFHKDSGDTPRPNIDYVLAATEAIVPFVKEGNIVILESTSPVGTTDEIARVLREGGIDTDHVHVAHCPERVLPGHIMRELIENDRVVGGTTPEATKVTAAFYRTFVEGEVLETEARTAEMAKLTENSCRDVQIAFANELSLICDKMDIDVWELIRLSNRHPRINILTPGVGVGGHCIAVDPWFIVDSDPENSQLIRKGREVNLRKTEWVIEKIKSAAGKLGKEKPVVALMGLAFKPDIDDLRESPAVHIANALKSVRGMDLLFVEPNITEHPDFKLTTVDTACEQADLVVFLVRHKAFVELLDIKGRVLDFCGVKE
ncbi:MAG: UDP-N-acetyl-D-mannosamine dehydrogenase [Verrucomicrobia bacterium]|nr:MAG: UDP-N-acetyl-D-mannosamine dehydrogenase [Verrucomicrobiota bacterium]